MQKKATIVFRAVSPKYKRDFSVTFDRARKKEKEEQQKQKRRGTII